LKDKRGEGKEGKKEREKKIINVAQIHSNLL